MVVYKTSDELTHFSIAIPHFRFHYICNSIFNLMTIHKEGYPTLAWSAIILAVINLLSFYLLSFDYPVISAIIAIVTVGLFIFLISFFRVPKRVHTINENAIIAPADGKVVTIEEVEADEYFNDRRIQVSIFMSPLNVHVNRNPVSGEVMYSQYHKRK